MSKIENPMYTSDPPEPEPFTEKSVDLKWSLWSRDKGVWDERAPGVWELMHDAFFGHGNVSIETAPRKEIRFGIVLIRKGAADVEFEAEWDHRKFVVHEVIWANLFEDLMHHIDHREVDLMRDEHKAYHSKHGEKLTSIRCHECGYPYEGVKSKRLAE